jgi:hypothetical protein
LLSFFVVVFTCCFHCSFLVSFLFLVFYVIHVSSLWDAYNEFHQPVHY